MNVPEAILAWSWSKACNLLDEGIDPRQYEIPKLISEFRKIEREPEDSAVRCKDIQCKYKHTDGIKDLCLLTGERCR